MITNVTRYQKELARLIAREYGNLSADKLIEKLYRMGVIDHSLCKVLTVRRWVDDTMKSGYRKGKAMLMASDKFCTSYDYIRKCMYYYTDVNL